MSTAGNKRSEGTKEEKTRNKKSKKKLLPFLRRRLSDGNIFVRSSSFPKFSAEEKQLQPENRDAARTAASCSGGELRTCAITKQVGDPAGRTQLKTETQGKKTDVISGTEPVTSSSSREEPCTSIPDGGPSARSGQSPDREQSTSRGQSPDRGQSTSRGVSSRWGQSSNKGPFPKEHPSREPSPRRSQSPNRGSSPKRGQSPNKCPSPKGGQSPSRGQSPRRGHSPSRGASPRKAQCPKRGPSPKRGQSPNRSPSLSRGQSLKRVSSPKRGQSPSRCQSPSRGCSHKGAQSPANRGTSLKRVPPTNTEHSPKRGQSPSRSASPKRGHSPKRSLSPKQDQLTDRELPSTMDPSPNRGSRTKRNQSPSRRPSSKQGRSQHTASPTVRGQSPDRASSPEKPKSSGSGSASMVITRTSTADLNLMKKQAEISDFRLVPEDDQQHVVTSVSADQETSLDVVLEQPERELEETCSLPAEVSTDRTGQLYPVLDTDKLSHEEDSVFPGKAAAATTDFQVTADSVGNVSLFQLQDGSEASQSIDKTVGKLQHVDINSRELSPVADSVEMTDDVRPQPTDNKKKEADRTREGSTDDIMFVEHTGGSRAGKKAAKYSTPTLQKNSEVSSSSRYVTKLGGPGCPSGHAATAGSDSGKGHDGTGNVESDCAGGLWCFKDSGENQQEIRGTFSAKQPSDRQASVDHLSETGTPVSASISTDKQDEAIGDRSAGKGAGVEEQQVGFLPSHLGRSMDCSTSESTCRGNSIPLDSVPSTAVPTGIVNTRKPSPDMLNVEELQGSGVLSVDKYSCDEPGHDNTPAATQQEIKDCHHNKTMDENVALEINSNSDVRHGEGAQSYDPQTTRREMRDVTSNDICTSDTSTTSAVEYICDKPEEVKSSGVTDRNHENRGNNVAEETSLVEEENRGTKSPTESETVSPRDEHIEDTLSTRDSTSSPLEMQGNGSPVKLSGRCKKSSIPRRESTDSEKEEAGNTRKDAMLLKQTATSRSDVTTPPVNGSGGGGKRINSKTTKNKVSPKTPGATSGGGTKAGMSGKRTSRSTTSLADGQTSSASSQRSPQLQSVEEMTRLPDSIDKNMTWPKQKRAPKEDKREDLTNFRRTSSLRLPTKEKSSFKRSVSFKLTERSESMSSLGSEASLASRSDQSVSAAVAATREAVRKEWDRRLLPHCPVPAPEPDKYLTPIQQKDFILRHLADLYKDMNKVISDRERQLTQTEDNIRKLTEELSHREDDVIRMGTEIELSSSRMEDLTTEVRCLEAELAQHREAALSAQDEVSDEEYQRLEAQTELEEVKGHMEAARRRASELQVAVDARETMCTELRKKVDKLQADLKTRDQETQRRFLEMYEKGRAAEQFEQSENLLYDAMTAPGQTGPVQLRSARSPSPRQVRRHPSSLQHGQVNVGALLRRIKQLEEQLIQARGDQRKESYRRGEKAESDVQVKLRVLRDAVFYYLIEREREQNLQMILEICNYNDKQKKMIIKTLKQKD